LSLSESGSPIGSGMAERQSRNIVHWAVFQWLKNRPFCTCRACCSSLNRKEKRISRLIYAQHDNIELIWEGHEDQGSTRAARPTNSCCADPTRADFATF
jgi:hypothetical protein